MSDWRSADRTPPEDRPTVPVPPGRPCGAAWCGDMALHGDDRCERHALERKATLKMHAVVLEAFREACASEHEAAE